MSAALDRRRHLLIRSDRLSGYIETPEGRNCENSSSESAIGRELGFNKSKPAPRHGVAGCCSFNWAMHPYQFWKLAIGGAIIKDEYYGYMRASGFARVLSECPIRFLSIGENFS